MLHQRSRTDEIQMTPGGYGSGSCGSGIVQTSLTIGLDRRAPPTGDISETYVGGRHCTLPRARLLAIVAPGNHGWSAGAAADATARDRIEHCTRCEQLARTCGVASVAPRHAALLRPRSGCTEPTGQATAVTFASPYVLAVQEREPAAISFYDLRTQRSCARASSWAALALRHRPRDLPRARRRRRRVRVVPSGGRRRRPRLDVRRPSARAAPRPCAAACSAPSRCTGTAT